MEGWKLLTRLWSEGANGKRRGKGGVETPDTSLVRRNQIKQRGEKGRTKKGGGVETPDASLVRGNQKKKERGRGRQERREERRGGRLSSLTRLWSDNPNQIGARVWDVDTEWGILI